MKNKIKDQFFAGHEAGVGSGAWCGRVVSGLGWMGHGVSFVVFGEAAYPTSTKEGV